MARRAVITVIAREDDRTADVAGVFWIPVPAARQVFYAKPADWQSVVIGQAKPTAAELADLRSGAVTEVETLVTIRKYKADDKTLKTSAELLADIRQQMTDNYTAEQAKVNDPNHPWRIYGTNYDTVVAGNWTTVSIA